MSSKSLTILFVLLICTASASAEITLRNNFFTGWQYSTNGTDYAGVGISGNALYLAMEGNDLAQSHMRSYKASKIWATILGYPGGFLLGWPVGGYMATGEWQDNYTTMIAVGALLAIVSFMLEDVAIDHMKKAVEIYNNGEHSELGLTFNWRPSATSNNGLLVLGISYGF
jgi:hypothetical protein